MNKLILLPLTDLQKQILVFIVHFFNRYHYPPTYNELSNLIIDKDSANVRHVVNSLVIKGYLYKSSFKHRGILPSKLLSQLSLRQIKRIPVI